MWKEEGTRGSHGDIYKFMKLIGNSYDGSSKQKNSLAMLQNGSNLKNYDMVQNIKVIDL